METVIITGRIGKNKKSEFFQVMEPLKTLVKNYCKDFDIVVSDDDKLAMRIIFDNKNDPEKNFNNKEFNILKGSIRSLCHNVNIKILDN